MPYAYVAAYVEDSCTIIDVTTPAAPTYAGHVAGVGAPNFLNYAAEIYVLGNYAYIGALLDTSLTIINVSNPAAPVYAGNIAGVGGPIYLNEARGIFVRRVAGNILAYVVSSPENTFSIFNVTNPAAITLLGSVTGIGAPNYLQNPRDIVVEGDYAYIASNSDVAVPIFNVSDPTNPTIAAVVLGIPFGLTAQPHGVAWNNNHIYVVCSGATGPLSVVDVTDPTAPVYRGNIDHVNLNGSVRVFIDGTHAYVAATTADLLTIIDISNPAAPAWAAAIGGAGAPNWLNSPQDVFVADGVAHVAAILDDSVSLFDVSAPAAPALLGNIQGAPNFLNGAWGIAPHVSPSTVPTVQTDPATSIISNAASLNGTLDDDGGLTCDCGFEWGETPAYGNTTPTQSRTIGQTFSQTLYPLRPNTTYYFRAFATNELGTSYGAQRSFTTTQVPYYDSLISPQVQTNPATLITEHTARLNGVVIEDGGVMGAVRFQWGLTTEYGNNTPWQQGYGEADEFFIDLNNLAEGQGFHFRAQFRVGGNLVSGRDMVFNTLSPVGPVTLVTDEIIQLLETV